MTQFFLHIFNQLFASLFILYSSAVWLMQSTQIKYLSKSTDTYNKILLQ